MATVDKHPNSRFFRARYIDATGRRVCRTLKIEDRATAMKMAADFELATRQARQGAFTKDRGRQLVNQLLVAVGGRRWTR
ncbi:MAG: hypothetical protein KA004_07010 [Verrucomicrobiales bacterium]|nr:hypothetical protein [Verrucomicrobiales bacterium]